MKYNPCDRSISLKLKYRYSWNLKNSTFTLTVLDIINHNFPLIIKNRTECLLCNSSIEINDHLWSTVPLLYDIFKKHQLTVLRKKLCG
jgi:hypothetical protein